VLFSLLALGAKPKENAMRLTLSSTMFLKPKENPMKRTLRVTVFAKPKVMNYADKTKFGKKYKR
jgi:hypothetical protein